MFVLKGNNGIKRCIECMKEVRMGEEECQVKKNENWDWEWELWDCLNGIEEICDAKYGNIAENRSYEWVKRDWDDLDNDC